MARQKVRLSWVTNETSRAIRLKKRRQGLVKKVQELSILCDIKACLIMFIPNEIEPEIWPSQESVRDLLDKFFALPIGERKKKEVCLDSYIKSKTKKIHEQLNKYQKKIMDCEIHKMMMQLQEGYNLNDLNLDQIYKLMFYSRKKIMACRDLLYFIQHPPLPELPTNLHQSAQQHRSNDVEQTIPRQERINLGLLGNQSHYIMDQWVSSTPSSSSSFMFGMDQRSSLPIIHQQNGIEMMSNYNQNLSFQGSFLPYQGSSSSSNGNPNFEMGMANQERNFNQMQNNNSRSQDPFLMGMNQNWQYPFDVMGRGYGNGGGDNNIDDRHM